MKEQKNHAALEQDPAYATQVAQFRFALIAPLMNASTFPPRS